MTNEQEQEALDTFRKTMADKRATQLQHLEALTELFKEARVHAAGRIIRLTVPASKILDGTWSGDTFTED